MENIEQQTKVNATNDREKKNTANETVQLPS